VAQTAPMSLEFRRGIDARNSARLVDPSFLLQAQNRFFDADVGLKKRTGYTALPKTTQSGGELAKGTSIVAYKDELLLFDDTYLWSYSADAGWLQRGTCIPTTVGLRAVQNTYNPHTCDYLMTPTLEAWVSQDSRNATDVRVTIADRLTGAIVLNDYLLASGKRAPRFVQTASGWLLLYLNGFQLYARPFIGSASSPFGSEQFLAVVTNRAYDVAFDGTTTLIAYFDNANAGSVTVAPLAADGSRATPVDSGYGVTTAALPAGETTSANEYRIGLAFDPTRSGYAMVAVQHKTNAAGYTPQFFAKFINAVTGGTWSWTDPDVVTWQWTDTANAGTGQPVMSMPVTVDASGLGHVYASYRQVGYLNASNTVRFVTNSPGNATDVWYGAAAISTPFFFGGDQYVWLLYNAPSAAASTYTTQRTAFGYNVTKKRPVARLGYGLMSASLVDSSEATFSQAFLLPRVLSPDASSFVFAGLRATLGGIGSANLSLSFVPAWQLRSTRLGESQVLCGGIVQSYDGATLTEHGFLLAPEIISVTSTGAGNVDGNVQYAAHWEWTDAAGQRHRSAPSTAVAFVATTDVVAVKVNSLPALASNKSNVALVVYRTGNNGQLPQRLGSVANDPTVPSLTYTDNAADAAIAANEILYTIGGELPNDPPPASQVICASKNRLFVAGGDDYDVVTYSKTYSKNAGPAFSLAFTRRISSVPGPITGIAAMDDKIVVFKNPGIFWWNGNGPSVSGVNDDFSPTQLLTAELGCLNPASLVTTQDGVYFQSSKGLWLLTRSLELVQVGAPVQGYDKQTVVSAVMLPNSTQMRFGCLEDSALVYHYRMLAPFAGVPGAIGQWTTFTNHAQAGAAIWRGVYTFVRADGSVWTESADYQDPTGPISALVQTAWLKAGSPLQAGQHRQFGVLGTYAGPHKLRIDIAHDYRTVPFATCWFDTRTGIATTAWGSDPTFGTQGSWGGDSDDTYVVRGILPVQLTTSGAVQFTLSDVGVPGETFGDSAVLEALALLVQPDAELIRPGPKKQVG
jgi:hypothetical protein